jgi:ATP adenylyltransferase
MQFLQEEKQPECFFCQKANAENDRESYVLARGGRCFILLNVYPYTSGHLLIAPYEHTSDFGGLARDTASEMTELAQRSVKALAAAYRTDSFNIGMNLGSAAGAGIADHLHLHVVPRWPGDNNFMPVIGDTRLLPETLETTYDRLADVGIGRGS